jgi:ArsR family transcriptional regulator
MLQEAVDAFQKIDYSNLTAYEAIRAVTGRDMTGKLDNKVGRIEKLVFVPTAHIGPYIGKLLREDTLYVLFGARLPRGVQSSSSELSRAELLIRLNALSDETRLRILELLTQHDELCAQDFVERIGLSQPTISRHLSQLSATGYIVERRRDVAKCYSLNSERMTDTLRALKNFLSRQ